LGGGDSDFADAVAVDGQGNATVLGSTFSADFPIANAFQPHLSADCDPPACRNGFVAKLNATGSAFVYSTYLGSVQAHSVAVDSQGTAYIVGGTSSVAYPVTPNAIQHCNSHFEYFGGGSGFVSVLAADGRLNYSTFLGGAFTDQILTIAVRGQQVYLGGRAYSVDFPVTPNATQTALRGSNDGFAAVIDFSVSYSGPPRIDPGCVVNGASFLAGSFPAGSIAPGEIVSIFGTGLGPASGAVGKIDPSGMVSKSLAGVTVTFDGVSAPLLWAQDTQVNAIVPFGLAGKTTTQVAVEYQGAMSQKISVPVSASAPGIFALNSSGVGQALAVNPDGSLNGASNPAVRGSVLTFWLTGGGVFTQTYSDGQIAPPVMAPLSATLGAKFGDGYGAPAEVQYSGQAPGLVAGATQVNVVVPMDAPTGPSVPLYVGVGGGFTQGHPAPTVAIQ